MKNFIKWRTVEFIEYNGLKIPTRLLSEEDLKMILKEKSTLKGGQNE